MAEYIERGAVIAEIVAEAEKQGKKSYDMAKKGCDDLSVKYTHGEYCYNVAERIVKSAPAANVVEVVRCKECKHYQNHPNGLCYLHTEPYGDGYKGDAVCVEPNGFCSYGERKEIDNDTK